MLKEILRELDDTLCNDDLDAMIEGNDFAYISRFLIYISTRLTKRGSKLFIEIDSDGSGTVDFDGEL